MNETPNHALQRTGAAVTPAASTAAFPPTTQRSRQPRRSLSLGSFGDYTHNPIQHTMNRIITSITLILALVFPVAMSGAPAEPAKKDWSPTEIQQLRDQVNDGRSKLFLEVMAIDRWTMDKLKESAALAESPKQIEQMLAICMDSSKRLKALTEQMPNDELRKAVSGIDATFVKALGHFLNLHKGKSKGPRDLTKTNWDVEHQNAVQEFKNIYVPLLLWNKLSLSPDESSKITSLILSLEK